METMQLVIRWIAVLLLAWGSGQLVRKIKMPAILGWLIAGMALGPFGFNLLSQPVMDATWFQEVSTWMKCAFGLMLGTELLWNKLKNYGKALIVTTLFQTLGTFLLVSLVFGIAFKIVDYPLWLAFAFGGIALATAPAPALSIVQEFQTEGPVTDGLLPMAILDDVIAIIVFFHCEFFYCNKSF